MSIIGSNILAGSSGQGGAYEIEQSLRFNSADSAYLNRTPASAGNRKTFTYSFWIKRAKLGAYQRVLGLYTGASFDGSLRVCNDTDSIGFESYVGSLQASLVTSSKYRDPSAWMHVVYSVDTTQVTASDRVKIYVNGQQVTSFSTATYPSQNADLAFNNNSAHYIGQSGYPSEYLDAYLAEFNFIDGTALDPSSFGEYDDNGVWRPIKYAGSYTGQSWYLKFASGDGTDSSGLSNTWTANNFTTSGTGTDVMSDTPTTNWATLNAIDPTPSPLSEGNLKVTGTNSGWSHARSTFAMSSGKWYWEDTISAVNYILAGVVKPGASFNENVGQNADSWGFIAGPAAGTGQIYNNNSGTNYGTTVSSGETLGFAFDADTGKMWVRNSSGFMSSGDPVAGTNPAMTAGAGTYFAAGSGFQTTEQNLFNFGQRAFAYTPPTGFEALNTANLPEPTVKDGGSYFDTITYSGATSGTAGAGTTQTVTGLGFSPDLVWIKNRSNANSHGLFDQVRGAVNALRSDLTNTEATTNSSGALSAFNSNGFTLANGSSGSDQAILTHQSGYTYVAWAWDAGGSGSSNTDGDITSTVSANPSAGFSIVSYAGNNSASATVGHGLGVSPGLVIVKDRSTSDYVWMVKFAALGGNILELNGRGVANAPSSYSTGTIGTLNSTTFGFTTNGSLQAVNGTGQNYIAYCFAEVEGYSKFGSYTGNGSTDGPFVYCGFRPRWVMIKNHTNSGWDWWIHDTARDPYNDAKEGLLANSSSQATTGQNEIDILSNGFKTRGSFAGGGTNASGNGYIFAAFAEHPTGGDGVSPATAR
jgi:hypothetical protein